MLGLSLLGCAHTRTVSGRLLYQETREPAANVTLVIERSPQGVCGNDIRVWLPFLAERSEFGETVTDEAGRFTFRVDTDLRLQISPVSPAKYGYRPLRCFDLSDIYRRPDGGGPDLPTVVFVDPIKKRDTPPGAVSLRPQAGHR